MNIPDPAEGFIQVWGKKSVFLLLFLNGKKDEIKRKTKCQAFEQGGLKMVNIHEHLSAMKINWLRLIFQPNNCKECFDCCLSKIRECPRIQRGIRQYCPSANSDPFCGSMHYNAL